MIKLTLNYNKRFSRLKNLEKLNSFKDFKLLSSNFSDDFKIQVNELIHEPTDAKVYYLRNNDQDNTFATVFKTFPSDSKGCPHILQHLACCGSNKYPIRDPFFNMLKRSVNTYMNAWTGQDFTCYPFSSSNQKDWRNLFNVYTDMAFSPLLNELDFMQQGWRYQINENGQKQIKGIVFNEMKGAYQSSQRQLMMALNEGLYGGTGYRFDSGGKPQQIVNLTYSQLKEMYNYFYHPSNASLFFYGNQDIGQSLQQINDTYLKNYKKITKYEHGKIINPQTPKQKFKTIVSKTAQTNSISLFIYIKNIEEINPVETLCFKILQYLTLQKNTSYVYEKFIQAGKAQNIGHSGYNESKLASFGVTLKGVDAQYSCEQYYKEIMSIFQKISTQGINQGRFNQFLHELQIGIKTPRENYGIKILGDCLNYMNHRLELINYLSPLKYIEQVKSILLNKQKLGQFIRKNLIDNAHYVVVKQVMDEAQQQDSNINSQTDKIISNIEVPIQQIKLKQQQLKQRQSTPQNINVLPKLTLSDLSVRKRIQPNLIENMVRNQRNIKYYHIPIENQIHFYRFVFNFKNISFDLNDKLSLWNFILNKGISTKKYNYKELSSKLGQFTAGFSSTASFGTKNSVNIVLNISCLKRNKEELFKLIQQILFQPIFEDDNIANLYRSFQNQAVQALTDSPISQCVDECGSTLNLPSRLFNKYQKIKEGLHQIKRENTQELLQINKFLLSSDSILLIEHSNEKSEKVPEFFKRFEGVSVNKNQKLNFTQSYLSKAVTHNFDVNFCSQQYKGPNYLSKQHAELCIFTQHLQQQFLHPQIRQKGGAYGARSNIRQSGNICLYSYMDPQCTKTFKVFDQSLQKLNALDKIQQQKLEQIKITLIGELERVKIPQQECIGAILKQYSTKQYEQFIEWTKGANSKEIIETGRKYIDPLRKSRCVFGKQIPQGFTQEKLSDFI